jgi:hypothetical protein
VAYTHFRYIAYEVPTVTRDPLSVSNFAYSGYPPGDACDEVPDMPVLGNERGGPGPDWWIRLRRLAAVVNLASQHLPNIGDDDATLKVFVAPEFYFRPAAPTRGMWNSYTKEDKWWIWRALGSMFQNHRYTHWLIVPGTVVWQELSSMPTHPGEIYYNTVPYVRGGSRDRPVGQIEKYLPSGIDGIPDLSGPAQHPQLCAHYDRYEIQRRHLFYVGGCLVGVEVCLDHANPYGPVLRRLISTTNSMKHVSWKHVPALHVLTAGGMPLIPASVAARTGGCFLRNDGIANGDGSRQSELYRVLGYESPNGGNGAPWIPGSTARLGLYQGNRTSVGLADRMIVPSMRGIDGGPGPYHSFTQQLRIYPRFPLP